MITLQKSVGSFMVAQLLQTLIFNPAGQQGRIHLFCNEHITVLANVLVTCIPKLIPRLIP